MLLKYSGMYLLLAVINAVILPPDKSDVEKNFIDILSDKLMNAKPEIDLSLISKNPSECYKDSVKYLNALKKFEFWALQSECTSECNVSIFILCNSSSQCTMHQQECRLECCMAMYTVMETLMSV